MHHKLVGCISTLFPILFFLLLLNNWRNVEGSHWINLNVWHDELTALDAESSMSNNVTTIANPGGNRPSFGLLPDCQDLDGLTNGQIKLCLLFSDHMKSIIQGAKLGLSECRWQFRHSHWNCSTLPLKSASTTETPLLTTSQSPNFTPQSRVLRENKSGSTKNPGRKRKARNHQNATDNLNLGKESYYISETSSKPKKKNRKNQLNQSFGSEEPTENNYVGGGTTTISKASGRRQLVPEQSIHLHHNDKEEKANWNSFLGQGNKEVAFAQAVWSAAVTEAVARSCREGSISSCGCGKTPRPADLKDDWRWGGCGDNLQYGYKFAQSFVDIREQENTPLDKKAKGRTLINLHNNEAGRRAVLKKTKIACKCHGVSGSCALVTCWHQIPSFREIGDFLKIQYDRATPVKLNRRGRLQVKKSGIPVPSVVDLVFTDTSPNYCVHNETLGIYGTSGRTCSRDSSAPNSCNKICCGRGFTTMIAKSGHRCNCKFIWCCQVQCEKCRTVEKYDVCK